MFKRILIAILIVSAVIAVMAFHLPGKAAHKLIPLFLQFRYGIYTEAGLIEGGGTTGIVIENAVVSTRTATISCERLVTDIKFIDLVTPHFGRYFSIYLKEPRILLKNVQRPSFRLKLPFWLKTHIFISGAQISFKSPGQSPKILLTGIVDINRKKIQFNKCRLAMDKLELNLEGSIGRNKELDIEANFINSDNKFLIKGALDKPRIYTKWNNLETSFMADDIKYSNGQLVLPKITGSINLQRFRPIDLEGELVIDKEFMKFNNMTILNMIKVNGAIFRNKLVKIKLFMKDIDGSALCEKLPDIARVFMRAHKVNANFNVFGTLNRIQAGGEIGLFSTPLQIACRYRADKFSFRSVGQGMLGISGSVNWDKTRNVKIKGLFDKMDINEFMALLGKGKEGKRGGIISGQFKITGEMESPLVELKLEIQDAEFGKTKFDTAYLNLQGTGFGPLYLQHSLVYYKNIPAELTGYIDPTEKDFFKHIEIHPTAEGFILDGIDIVKDAAGKTVTFGKDVNEKISVHFKSVVTSDPEQGGEKAKPEVELEYKLKDNKNLMIKMDEDENTVGVKQKVQF